MLAMVVNDNACLLVKRGALESIASELAPTGDAYASKDRPAGRPPRFGFRGARPTEQDRSEGMPSTSEAPNEMYGQPIFCHPALMSGKSSLR